MSKQEFIYVQGAFFPTPMLETPGWLSRQGRISLKAFGTYSRMMLPGLSKLNRQFEPRQILTGRKSPPFSSNCMMISTGAFEN